MENKIDFTHLHVHSGYSLLDGSSKIDELIDRTKQLEMDSIAITDHGVMFGVIDFYKKAKENNIKPILGCEIYVASQDRKWRENSKDNFYYHLILLAENNKGFQNLMKLSSFGFTEGFYYKPRVDIELLSKYKEGLIATSACLSGPVSKNLLKFSYEKGKEQAILYNNIFGQNNFFLELQDHGLIEQKQVNQQILKISTETGIPVICANDVHYIYEGDSNVHDVLICIQTNKTIYDENRMKYEGKQFYLKSPQEMYKIFAHIPEALENTTKIASRCNVDIKFHDYKLPKYNVPDNKDAFEFLYELCYKGMENRYSIITDDIINRLNYELSIIKTMGFIDYFLITWDFIKYARDNGIPVGPGRGSATGCLVAYCLGITGVDPIKYDLIFERFLNPERISMPDIDIDFCYERRQEVIDYVVSKYGVDHVSQIITFGTMAAKGVIRDVGRALGMPYGEVDKIAKMIPFVLTSTMTISKAMYLNPDLKKEYDNNEDIKKLIDIAKRLEGLPRHASTHAAGVVICNEPVGEYVPLYEKDGIITTQFSMTTIEELGLLKIDFLGLRTLTVINRTVKEIKRIHKIDIDLNNLNMTDEKVYDMISQAKTEGVFQLESAGMKNFMKELMPTCIEDLVAGISLYRPGPMDFIPKYVNRKNNKEEISYLHKSLESILKPTYGCIVYQEQVMQIVQKLAGYSLGRSDLVRRAMSKKKSDIMEHERKNFVHGIEGEIRGCVKNGIPENIAEKIFDEMIDFAKYAFNKSHAVAYALIGYQTAWLKYYYPTEFMAALMTSVMDNTTKIAEYIYECKNMNIDVLPPDINESFSHFSVSNNKIRFGFKAIKNVGQAGIEAVINERNKNGEFKSLTEFINRVNCREINKRMVESFIKAGVFDTLGGKRQQYISIYERIMNGVSTRKKNTIEGQIGLFDLEIMEEEKYEDIIPKNMPEYPLKQLLTLEKEVLGVYITGHPMLEYMEVIKDKINCTSIDFIKDDDIGTNYSTKMFDNKQVFFGGIIIEKSVKYTKNGKIMSFLKVEDLYGSVEVILFSDVHSKYNAMIEEGDPILVYGKAKVEEYEYTKIICTHIQLIENIMKPAVDNSKLWIKKPEYLIISYSEILEILKRYPGNTPIVFYDEATSTRQAINNKYNINSENDSLITELKQLLGNESVVLKKYNT